MNEIAYLVGMAAMGSLLAAVFHRDRAFFLSLGVSVPWLAFMGLVFAFLWPLTIILALIIKLLKIKAERK